MPSVRMRRSTRVLGARVLRSGRRLWTEPHEVRKQIRAPSMGNEWIYLLDNSVHGGGHARDRCKDKRPENGIVAVMDVDAEPRQEEHANVQAVEVKRSDRICQNVYIRKRKRSVSISYCLSEEERFGKKFARRLRGKSCWDESSNVCGASHPSIVRFSGLAVFPTASSYDSLYWFSYFLCAVLGYMTKVRTDIPLLSTFLMAEPIFGAYSSHGLHFLQGLMVKKPGVCIISGCSSLVPLFVVDFAAVPFCFMHIHRSIHLRSMHISCCPHANPLTANENYEIYAVNNNSELLSFEIPSAGDIYFGGILASDKNDSELMNLTHSVVGPKPASQTTVLRKSRKIRKRWNSLRWRRSGRSSSAVRSKKASETLVSEFLKIQNGAPQISAAASNRVLRSSHKKHPNADVRECSSTTGVLPLDISAVSCFANLLIIDKDKCYREEGAAIDLELSASKQWCLSVMKDGLKRYALTPHKLMRPPFFNRFTHATVWASDAGWKLEFPNRHDWFIFKELYKDCSDHNVSAPAATIIPVPGVQKVSYSPDGNYIPYVRPESYISVKDDELIRALMRNGANYDMDSEDEEWLKKFNIESFAQRGYPELITSERFELIIDALEKGSHCCRGGYVDPVVFDFLERKYVLEAVRAYWINKRRQRQSALVRIFQLYQPRKTHAIPRSVPRRKRSFKRQSSQNGRGKGKQIVFLQAMAAERDAIELRNKLQEVQEAKAAADRYEEIAVLKRHRAQMLMENSDLAMYKSVMAVRIAEAAQVANGPPGTVASFLLVDGPI